MTGWRQGAAGEGATVTKRTRMTWAGLVLTAALTIVAMVPTAIEYAVMTGGITFNVLD